MAIAAAGAYLAETWPFSSRLISTDPSATPTEKMARNRVATSWLE